METWRKFFLAVFALLTTTATIHAQTTRTYAGTYQIDWRTAGQHGHDQPPCAEPRERTEGVGRGVENAQCDPFDFARGNLDNSIGFRSGRERDLKSFGPLSIVGGVDGSVLFTEYNLSQKNFFFATASAITGADLRVGPVLLGGRAGIGPFATTDGAEYGFQHFRAAHLTVPIRPGAAIRISRNFMSVFGSDREHDMYGLGFGDRGRVVLHRAPKAIETSILLVTSPEFVGSSLWEFSAATGRTRPGGPIGGSRKLRATNFNQISAFRDLPWHRLQARLTWTSTAHESRLPSTFFGYDQNFRSKTVDGLGLGIGRTTERLFDHFTIRYGAGIEVADWRDEHQLLTRDEKTIVAGIETAVAGDVAARWHVGRNLAFEGSFQKLYWRGTDLGEERWGVALVITSP